MQVRIAFVILEVRTEFVGICNMVDSIPHTRDCPPSDVPEFAGEETMRIRIIRAIRVVGETLFECWVANRFDALSIMFYI